MTCFYQWNGIKVKKWIWLHLCEYISMQCPSCRSVSLSSGFEEESSPESYSCREQNAVNISGSRESNVSFPSGASQGDPSLADSLIVLGWDPEQRIQLSCYWTPDPQKLIEEAVKTVLICYTAIALIPFDVGLGHVSWFYPQDVHGCDANRGLKCDYTVGLFSCAPLQQKIIDTLNLFPLNTHTYI